MSLPYESIDDSKEFFKRDNKHTLSAQQQGDFVNSVLYDVYSDFERTLERTSIPNKKSKYISLYQNESDLYAKRISVNNIIFIITSANRL